MTCHSQLAPLRVACLAPCLWGCMRYAQATQHGAGVAAAPGCVEWRRAPAWPWPRAPASCRRRLAQRCCAHSDEHAGTEAPRQTRRAAVAAAALVGLCVRSAAQPLAARALEAETIDIDMGGASLASPAPHDACVAAPHCSCACLVCQPDASGRLVFVPDRLTLKRNKLYRLVLKNPSPVYHNFVATDFLQSSLWLLTGMEQQMGETTWLVLPRKLGLVRVEPASRVEHMGGVKVAGLRAPRADSLPSCVFSTSVSVLLHGDRPRADEGCHRGGERVSGVGGVDRSARRALHKVHTVERNTVETL